MFNVRQLVAMALALAGYVAVGLLSLQLSTVHLSSSPVWPPAGIAIGLLVVYGLRAWPVVALGAFLVNAINSGAIGTSVAIAGGNTLEAIAAAWLIRRFAGDSPLEAIRGMLVIAGAAIVGAILSASIGVGAIVLDGVPAAQFGPIWLTWFLGNVGGTLLVLPLFLSWSRPVRWDAVALAGGTGVGVVSFATTGWSLLLMLPFVAYVSLTDHPFRRALALIGFATGAVGMTWIGLGPFRGGDGNEALLLLQVFMVGLILISSLLAAGIRRKGSIRRATSWPRVALAGVPLVAATMLIGLWFHPTLTTLETERNEESAEEAFDEWQRAIEDYEAQMKAIRGLYGSTEHLSRDTFDAYVEQQDWSFGPGGITAVGFARLVEVEDLETYIQETRNDPLLPPEVKTNFTVFPPPTNVSAPVDHVYPMIPQEGAIGFDLRSTPPRAAALDLAAATNSVIASEPTNIVRPDGEFPGFFLSLPVWNEGQLIGYVVLAQTVHDASSRVAASGLSYRITDVTEAPVELFATDDSFEVIHERTLAVWGRSWLFEFSDDASLAPAAVQSAWFVLGGGVVVSGAIAGIVYAYDTTRSRAHDMSRSLVDQARLDGERLAEIRRLEDRDEFRRQFLNMVAHELRTPLTPLRTQLYVLQQQAGPNDKKSFDLLQRGVDRLSSVVDDLLVASRLEAKGLALEKEPTDLHEVAANAVDSFSDLAKAAGTTLQLSGSSTPILADPVRLDQVVDNLLSNAIKFTPGGIVRVDVQPLSNSVRLVVADDGAGVDPNKLKSLGEPFVQAHDPNELPVKGTGLGLYICKSIVELHGGSLTIQSEGLGKGTKVTMTLPHPP